MSTTRLLKSSYWKFPGGPVVRTWHFPAVARVQSLGEELRSCKLCDAASHPPSNNSNFELNKPSAKKAFGKQVKATEAKISKKLLNKLR